MSPTPTTRGTTSRLSAEIEAAVSSLRARTALVPDVAIIIGTGLGALARSITLEASVPYREIPHFPESTVESHAGELMFGHLSGKSVVAMRGRVHFYEGYSLKEISLPVRVMRALGARLLVVSNACGGMNPGFHCGDIMVIEDHINLMGDNPLIGVNDDRLGPRFPDMGEAYDASLIKKALTIAAENGIRIRKGVYLSTSGPTFETPAEYRYFRIIGADAVGMSTTPEVIVARQMNLPCFAVSIITDLGVEGKIEYTTHESVQKEAEKTEAQMTFLLTEMISTL